MDLVCEAVSANGNEVKSLHLQESKVIFILLSPSQKLFGLIHVNVEDLNPVVMALRPAIGLPVAEAAVGVDVVRPNLEMIKHNLDLKQFPMISSEKDSPKSVQNILERHINHF